jgi:hypothetical protein
MLHNLIKKLEELLLPERRIDDGAQYLEPVDMLRLIHERISQLAQQIELCPTRTLSSGGRAPPPNCRREADSGSRLKQVISFTDRSQMDRSTRHRQKSMLATLVGTWRQKALDDLLSRYEFIVTRQVPEVADFLELKTLHGRTGDHDTINRCG